MKLSTLQEILHFWGVDGRLKSFTPELDQLVGVLFLGPRFS
jgi:hypothetical protein